MVIVFELFMYLHFVSGSAFLYLQCVCVCVTDEEIIDDIRLCSDRSVRVRVMIEVWTSSSEAIMDITPFFGVT